MADYVPLIARAINGLDQNTGENRRALYERARAALINQLRSVEPKLDEDDITRERLALEEAIQKVEADASKPPVPDVPAAPSLSDNALTEYRKTMAEAEGLGEASVEANRSARETYTHVAPGSVPLPPRPPVLDKRDATRKANEGTHYFEPPHSEAEEREAAHEPPRFGLPPDDEDEYARAPRDYSRIIKVALILLLVLGVGALGYWQRNTITSTVSSMFARSSKPTTTTTADTPAQPAGRPKISDRIGPSSDSNVPAASNAPAAAVAQKVVLYDEDPNDPQGKRYVGSAIWRTETVSPGPGLAPELAIRADIEIPERRMRMTWSLRRNADKALPASHTVEIVFTLPSDFDQGGINNVPGVLMKASEQARGVPLSGLAVKVTNGYFLIGLSAVDVDLQRNIQLLKERDWFDIPIVYNTNKRAILAVEKGTPGARAFQEAFRAWGQ